MKIFLYNIHRSRFLAVMLVLANAMVQAQPRDIVVHDPVMIKQNDTYYIFHTGKGIQVKSSKDMKTWKVEEPVFATPPSWILKTIPKFDGSIWPPMSFTGTGYIICIILFLPSDATIQPLALQRMKPLCQPILNLNGLIMV